MRVPVVAQLFYKIDSTTRNQSWKLGAALPFLLQAQALNSQY